jgi:hypothetical protein
VRTIAGAIVHAGRGRLRDLNGEASRGLRAPGVTHREQSKQQDQANS